MLVEDQRRASELSLEEYGARLDAHLAIEAHARKLDKRLAALQGQNVDELRSLRSSCSWLNPWICWPAAGLLGGWGLEIMLPDLQSGQHLSAGLIGIGGPMLILALALVLTRLQLSGKDPVGVVIERYRHQLSEQLPRLLDEQFQQELAEAIGRQVPWARQWVDGRSRLEDRLDLLGRFFPVLLRRRLQPEAITPGDCAAAILQLMAAKLHQTLQQRWILVATVASLLLGSLLRGIALWRADAVFLLPLISAFISQALWLLALPGAIESAALQHVVVDHWRRGQNEQQEPERAR